MKDICEATQLSGEEELEVSQKSSISESDDSESEYSSVEEVYGSGKWVCCRVSVEHGCSVGSGD